jgi:hypothetical protein
VGLLTLILFTLCGIAQAAAASCPALVKPVCAVTAARQLKTFSNACQALRAGAMLLHEEACLPEFCAHICIINGVQARGVFTGKVRFYDNLCWAEKDFARFIRNVPCQ